MDPFLGEIKLVGFNFAPQGWALCDGQVLSIAQNTALFSLLGTMYGGDGISTFALPDLRGRVPIHQGDGPSTSQYVIGQVGGTEAVTLTSSQMPSHGHALSGNSAAGTLNTPQNNFVAGVSAGTGKPATPSYNPTSDVQLNGASVGFAGGNQPHTNVQPYLCVNFIIALVGIFPSRG